MEVKFFTSPVVLFITVTGYASEVAGSFNLVASSCLHPSFVERIRSIVSILCLNP